MKHTKEKLVYKNKNGKIVQIMDMLFGGSRYVLFDAEGSYVKDLAVPFKVSDYL